MELPCVERSLDISQVNHQEVESIVCSLFKYPSIQYGTSMCGTQCVKQPGKPVESEKVSSAQYQSDDDDDFSPLQLSMKVSQYL